MSPRRGIPWPVAGLLAAALGVLPFAAASAQRNDEPETVILSHEQGTIVVGRDSEPLPWARSSSGPLVALGAVVDVLGGDLEIGPLGEAHTLRLAGRKVVLGPLSRTVTVDGEVHNLSIRPWIEPEPDYPDEEDEEDEEAETADSQADRGADDAGSGPATDGAGEETGPAVDGEADGAGQAENGNGEEASAEPGRPGERGLPPELAEPRQLFVPVDALARAYPETLGYRFDFDRRRGLLRVDRTGEPRLDVGVERVHDLGTTTLVVTFSSRPRFQVDRYRAGVRLRLLSGVMDPRRRVRLNDPLVRWIEVRERSVDIGLAPDAEAAEPYVLGRPPRIQLVLDVTRGRLGTRPGWTSRPEEERREFRIVLDPGHGGTDDGVRTPSGETEKNVTLGIAQALASHLQRELGARVVLTRGGDSTVALENRTSLANQYEADLFLSLHVVAGAASAQGSAFRTWVLDPPPAPVEEGTTEAAGNGAPPDASVSARGPAAEAAGNGATPDASVSARGPAAEAAGNGATPEAEPAPEAAEDSPPPETAESSEDEGLDDLDSEPVEEEPPVAVPPLEPWDRVHDRALERSARLARLIQTQVSDALGLRNRRVRRAPVRVLTGAAMPAVLIEFGYEESGQEMTPVFAGPRGRQVFEAISRAIRLYRGATAGDAGRGGAGTGGATAGGATAGGATAGGATAGGAGTGDARTGRASPAAGGTRS